MFLGSWVATAGAQPAAGSSPYTIAVRTLGPSNTDIFLADRAGLESRPLVTHPSLDYNATFSLDHRWIVFTSNRAGSADLYRVRLDGSQLERLTDEPSFEDQGALSPDGKSLAFVSTRSGQADIWILDLATGTARNLTNHPAGDFRPAWSPDGKSIAFSSDRDPPATHCPNTTAPGPGPFITPQYTSVFVVRIGGSGLRRVSPSETNASSPEWSDDGSRIAFHAAAPASACNGAVTLGRGPTQLMVVEVDTGKHTSMTSGEGLKLFPHWVDEHELAFVDTKGVRFTGETATRGADGQFGRPDWSPDRRGMVFHREADHSADRDREFKRAPSRHPRFDLLRVPGHASFAPDGERLVFRVASGIQRALYVLDLDDGKRRKLDTGSDSDTFPSWSPRGDWIAFTSKRDGNYEIYRIRPDGTGLQRLTDSPAQEAHPSFSPDGEWIAFATTAQGFKDESVALLPGVPPPPFQPSGEIAVMRPDGSDSQLLTDDSLEDGAPSWVPKRGKQKVAIVSKPSQIARSAKTTGIRAECFIVGR